jgi:glycosyltransferase involved in cell wall biosynthesis
MQNRGDMVSHRGGDVVQMEETAKSLRGRGWQVDISNATQVDYSKYGIVHLFNTTRINETWAQYWNARKSGCKIAISPIWHSMDEMRSYYCWLYGVDWFPVWIYGGLREIYYALRARYPLSLKAAFRYRECQRIVLSSADIILPNSDAEIKILERELEITTQRYRVVPNGFSSKNAAKSVEAVQKNVRSGIVCAGRVEPRKNCVQIIEAVKKLKNPRNRLTFYGKKNHAHIKYLKEFERGLIPGYIEYLGSISGQALLDVFEHTQVVVLASFYETTGLVGLEALSRGAKVVVLDSPYTREYFRDRAFYCNPYSVESITQALALALNEPPLPPPQWLSEFTWENAGYHTMLAYKSLFGSIASSQERDLNAINSN